MKLFALSAFACLAFGGAAMACPDYNQYGATYAFNGDEISDPMEFPVTAGGGEPVATCEIAVNQGFFTAAPDLTFELSQMTGHQVAIHVAAGCDAMLLVNSANALWHYESDSSEEGGDSMVLDAPGDGFLDIWVGTRSGAQCDATLTVEVL